MAKSVRIGNKEKSVRVKKYIIEFYCQVMGVEYGEALLIAKNKMAKSVERIGNCVDADLLTEYMLLDIEAEFERVKNRAEKYWKMYQEK